MCAGARQRSQIGASRSHPGWHEPPSATGPICAAHMARRSLHAEQQTTMGLVAARVGCLLLARCAVPSFAWHAVATLVESCFALLFRLRRATLSPFSCRNFSRCFIQVSSQLRVDQGQVRILCSFYSEPSILRCLENRVCAVITSVSPPSN